MKQFTDREILEAIRKGQDTEVIDSLYASLLPKVKRHVCSNNGSLDDAYDIFQDTIMVFYKLVVNGKFDSEKYNIHGFVLSIGKNLWINLVKKRANSLNREKNVEREEVNEDILLNLMSEERKMALDEAFQSLGGKCTEILVSIFYHHMSLKEIADKLGDMSEDAVKVKSHRCKKQLAEKIKGDARLLEQLRN